MSKRHPNFMNYILIGVVIMLIIAFARMYQARTNTDSDIGYVSTQKEAV